MLVFKQLFTFFKACCSIGVGTYLQSEAPNIDAQGTIHLQRLPIDRAQGDLFWVHYVTKKLLLSLLNGLAFLPMTSWKEHQYQGRAILFYLLYIYSPTNGHTDRETNGHVNIWTDGLMSWWRNEQTDGRVELADSWLDWRTDGRTDR